MLEVGLEHLEVGILRVVAQGLAHGWTAQHDLPHGDLHVLLCWCWLHRAQERHSYPQRGCVRTLLSWDVTRGHAFCLVDPALGWDRALS